MKQKLENSKPGLLKRAAKAVIAPLTAGLLLVGCQNPAKDQPLNLEGTIDRGPFAACQKKNECKFKIKKGDLLLKSTFEKSGKGLFDFRVLGVDSRGVSFQLKSEIYSKDPKFGKFRVDYDGTNTGKSLIPDLKNISVEKTSDAKVAMFSYKG